MLQIISFFIFVFFSQSSCGCVDYAADPHDNKTACEIETKCDGTVTAAMFNELNISPQLCSCVWNPDTEECHEDNINAQNCFQAISESICNKIPGSGPGQHCRWNSDPSHPFGGHCFALCVDIEGENSDNNVMADCMAEVGCFFSIVDWKCKGDGCSSYSGTMSSYCKYHTGCEENNGRCVVRNCTKWNNAEGCRTNPQCDWHAGGGKDCANLTECPDTICETKPTGCEYRQHCQPKVAGGGGGGGKGNQQCDGFGEFECAERLVCKYDGNSGCTYKGDRSLMTKVEGGMMTVVLVSLLLLFVFF